MFEQIVLRRSQVGTALTAGELAEALLFYSSVHVLLDHPSLIGLLKQIGPDLFCSLIESDRIKATYFRNQLGTHTETQNSVQTHRFIAFEFTGDVQGGQARRLDERLSRIFERATGESKSTGKFVKRFLDQVPIESLTKGFQHPGGIPGIAAGDLEDAAYVRQAVDIVLRAMLPGHNFAARWDFQIVKMDNGFAALTDLPFEELNKQYKRIWGVSEGPFTPAFLTNHILQARADLTLAVSQMAEFMTGQISSRIMEVKFANVLSKRYRNAHGVELFQQVVIPQGRRIKEVIDSGERSFEEFLGILEKANKFKSWLHNIHPDSNLVREYFAEVTKDTWTDNLPVKALRFVATSALGLAEPVSGAALGAADSFLLDRFAKGWRPNRFIESELAPFVADANQD